MNQRESRKLRWKITVGMEVLTSILAVPLAVLFIITAGGYDFHKSLALIICSCISLVTSFVVPAIRFFYLGRILVVLEPEQWNKLNPVGKSRTKARILNFPLLNTLFYVIQWSYGITFAWRIMHLAFQPTFFESLPFAFLPAIIYPILGVSHFFLTESILSSVLESDTLSGVQTQSSAVRKVSIFSRIFATIASISLLPVVIFGYLLFEETKGWIKLGDVTTPLVLTLFFMLITVAVASYLLAVSIRKNSGNMVKAFEEMSKGDLTIELPMLSTDELGNSSKSLNDFVKRLRIIVKSVIREAEKLSGSSKVLEENTKELSRKMQEQAAATEQMSAGVEEIAASVSSTASRADGQASITQKATDSLVELDGRIRQVHLALSETKSDADKMKFETSKGEEALLGTKKAMADIEESTSKMGATVNVIHEITDRIGLLSLNAAIEAARAGEAGKGFAVVAQEISKLGEQTQENAKRIRAAIQEALTATKSGREVIESTQAVFQKIGQTVGITLDRISEVADLSDSQLSASANVRSAFTDLSRSAEEIRNHTLEQSQTSAEFSRTIVSISETTELLNRVVSDIDNLAEKLAHQAASLKGDVEFFKT
ncbi:methyl-accepting chemotaxis protein signaling domain protein [Leptospira inadai serovar Lyme str. 10]|uniref:Methyl-accepting chemotaxis protein signaling domain protein n=2 Tax=Leptospira inadai serovar Lyme TaxID=293084 RepID=V6HA65_9LEPT|nr:methyl-accepting chemotaxis protein [Leptospira inadai]EQA36002.1 methyl-accepting chemotaxis protein signaling domain protein [Leptospira inadai serovar Lyme str. 10]PNV76776.1 methyl-accepting chemotaxis protein [Leptospira inadai serovar Lyme]